MKIIAGEFRGRNIKTPPEIRPVSLRVKKSFFDIFGDEVEGKRILDLFAGSGSLGIEALSRGASSVTFVDSERKSINVINKNITAFHLESKTRVFSKDAFASIKDFSVYREVFDLIFIDPPYYQGMLRNALQLLEDYDILASLGYIGAFCYHKDDLIADSRLFSLIVDKQYGQNRVLIYKKS